MIIFIIFTNSDVGSHFVKNRVYITSESEDPNQVQIHSFYVTTFIICMYLNATTNNQMTNIKYIKWSIRTLDLIILSTQTVEAISCTRTPQNRRSGTVKMKIPKPHISFLCKNRIFHFAHHYDQFLSGFPTNPINTGNFCLGLTVKRRNILWLYIIRTQLPTSPQKPWATPSATPRSSCRRLALMRRLRRLRPPPSLPERSPNAKLAVPVRKQSASEINGIVVDLKDVHTR